MWSESNKKYRYMYVKKVVIPRLYAGSHNLSFVPHIIFFVAGGSVFHLVSVPECEHDMTYDPCMHDFALTFIIRM